MQSIRIAELLSPVRVDLDCRITSKKRLMEHMASMLAREMNTEEETVFRVLIERERLGSTGIGQGVALPHARLGGIDDAVLALAVLHEPLDYQAPDQQDVQIVVGLLVPEAANDFHLRILARIAELLNQSRLRDLLLQAKDKEDVFSALNEAETE